MEIGILGGKQSGKSTLFKIMTKVDSSQIFGEQFVRGVARVPDGRFDKLVDIFKPKKVSPANVTFVDVNVSGENAWTQLRQNLASVDGFLIVVDAFTSDSVSELVKRYKQIEDEQVLSDLVVIENRLERLAKTAGKQGKPEDQLHLKILPEAKKMLESGKPLRDMKLSNEEMATMRGFTFWTLRPVVIVLNAAEGAKLDEAAFCKEAQVSLPVISICAQIEAEIAQLEKEDQAEFMASLGISVPAFELIIQTAFGMTGSMCYFTVGEDEVKAWVVAVGATAPRAAAAIHKDFERGFIKAEVIGYEDFINLGGTIAAVKAAGKYRLEGKEYIVKDGDIINFRFNV